MSKSRYASTPIINNHHYGTFSLPVLSKGYREQKLLEGVRTFEYTIKVGDRIDHLAARYLNDENLWWVIALGNGIIYPFASGGFAPGRTIKIPLDPKDVVDKVVR
jgi:hypothetical protein